MKVLVVVFFFCYPLIENTSQLVNFASAGFVSLKFWHGTVHTCNLTHLFLHQTWVIVVITGYIQAGPRSFWRQSSHPLCHVMLDQSWLYGCNIQSPACARVCTCKLLVFISQGRVSSAASSPWKVVPSSSCSPDLGSRGGPDEACGAPSWGLGVSWCLGAGAGQSGTVLGQGWRCHCRPCRWFLWWPEGGGEVMGRCGSRGQRITKEELLLKCRWGGFHLSVWSVFSIWGGKCWKVNFLTLNKTSRDVNKNVCIAHAEPNTNAHCSYFLKVMALSLN